MTEYTQSRASTKRASLSSRSQAKLRAGAPFQASAQSMAGPEVQNKFSPDLLSAKMESLKIENEILKGKLSEVRARSRQLLEVNKELKSRFSHAGEKARGSSAVPPAGRLSTTVHRSLLEMKEILESIQKMKFPFQVVSEEESVESETNPASGMELDEPALKRLEELQKRYHLPMPVVERVQSELACVAAQRQQAMELVREMHKFLSALGKERVRLAERISRTSEVLSKILEGTRA